MPDEPAKQVLVQGTYSLTEKDIYEAQVRHKGWLLTAIRIFGLLMVVVGTVSVVSRDWTGLFALIWGLFLIFQLRFSVNSSFKKNFAGQPETTMSASDNGLEFVNSKLDSSLKWSAYVAYAESANVFLLYTQSNIFNPIPKRALSAEGVDAFRRLLQQRVPPKPKRRGVLLIVIAVVAMAALLTVWAVYKNAH